MTKLLLIALAMLMTSAHVYAMDPQAEIAQLKEELDRNVARVTSKAPSPAERFKLCSRNCQISKMFLEQPDALDQATKEQLDQEFERNKLRLQYVSVTPKENFELGKRNYQISKRLAELEQK